MVLRFRKTIRLLPGVRLNVTKRGINSLSLGGKGASYNIGKEGTRTTLGLPGTGLSDTEYHPYEKDETGRVKRPALYANPRTWLFVLIFIVVVVRILKEY